MRALDEIRRELEAIAAECRDHARSGGRFGAPTVKWADQLEALALRLDSDEDDEPA